MSSAHHLRKALVRPPILLVFAHLRQSMDPWNARNFGKNKIVFVKRVLAVDVITVILNYNSLTS